MTLRKIDELPQVSRNGSGRTNETFTNEVLDTLRSAVNKWHIVESSDCLTDQEEIRKSRLNLYMRGKYARETYGSLETAVRTETTDKGKTIHLYARAL